MGLSLRFVRLPLVALPLLLCIAGCHGNQDQVAAASDPASANMAPVSADSGAQAPAQTGGQQAAAPQVGYNAQQSQPPPNSGGNYNQASDQYSEDPGYGEQPEYVADQAPPPLPEYAQPQDPGEGYLWTPGYWGWSQGDYYWVPGAWVYAPYQGALWTPGYWGYYQHHYRFYRGYWGQYVGFYGGIDYGFGYVGYGYQGGYWGGGHFNYNRSVNNLNLGVERNVYSRTVSYSGNYAGSAGSGQRVSFNGGSGGIQVQARPAELAALRAPHSAPMTAQVQNERAASTNREQFANVNHGRPATAAVSQPLAADRDVRAPAALQVHNQAVGQQQPQRQEAPQPRQAVQQQPQRQEAPQQRQAVQQQAQRQEAPQQRQAVQQQPQRQAVQQQPQRQAVQQQQQQRQEAPQQRQEAPQQRQAAQQQQQRQAAPQQQRQAPVEQRQAAPQQQHKAAPQEHQAAPQEHKDSPPKEEEKKK